MTSETVLVIDSYRLVAWSLRAWTLLPANYLNALQIGEQTLVTVTPVSHTSLHVYNITCLTSEANFTPLPLHISAPLPFQQ